MQFQAPSGGFAIVVTVVTAAFSFLVAITWLWIGWRAMRAHEQIADVLREKLDKQLDV